MNAQRMGTNLMKFTYKDPSSKTHAAAAFAGVPGVYVILSNRPGAGKSAFVRECLVERFPLPQQQRWPMGDMAMELMITQGEAAGYLWIDQLMFQTRRPVELLERFIAMAGARNMQTFLCGNFVSAPWLEEITRVIELVWEYREVPEPESALIAQQQHDGV